MHYKNIVLVIGSGSIAAKHSKNLISLGFEVKVFSSRKFNANDQQFSKRKITFINSIKKIEWSKISFGVIANSTHIHEKFINLLVKNRIHIFCEKPSILDLKNHKLLKKKISKSKLIFFVNYQLQRHSLLDKFIKIIKNEKISHILVHVSHDIKKWRVNKMRTKSYYLHTKLGGGVIYELIHEINLIQKLFGKIKTISSIKSNVKYKNCEDQSLSVFKTRKNISGFLYQDMISKQKKRIIEINTLQGKIITLDFIKNKIYKRQKNLTKTIVESNLQDKHPNLLMKNIIFFINLLKKNKKSIKFFEDSISDVLICKKMHDK